MVLNWLRALAQPAPASKQARPAAPTKTSAPARQAAPARSAPPAAAKLTQSTEAHSDGAPATEGWSWETGFWNTQESRDRREESKRQGEELRESISILKGDDLPAAERSAGQNSLQFMTSEYDPSEAYEDEQDVTTGGLDFGDAADEVRQLTMDEWNALSPTQQRAVVGNYELYQAREDPEKQAEILETLHMDTTNWTPDEGINGYASYEDILSLAEHSSSQAPAPSLVDEDAREAAAGKHTDLDSLVALANSVYYASEEGLGTQPDKIDFLTSQQYAIDLPGMADFSEFGLSKEEAAWVDENVVPFMLNDQAFGTALRDQEALDSFFEELNANLPGVDKARLSNHLFNSLQVSAPAAPADDLYERLNVLGLGF